MALDNIQSTVDISVWKKIMLNLKIQMISLKTTRQFNLRSSEHIYTRTQRHIGQRQNIATIESNENKTER